MLRYGHESTSLQTCRAQENTADTASFLQQFGYGITCLLVSSRLLPSRCSSPTRTGRCHADAKDRLDKSCFYQHIKMMQAKITISSLWAAPKTSLLWQNFVPGWDGSARMRMSKRGTPLKIHYFAAIGFYSVKTVAGRYRLAAYHSKRVTWALLKLLVISYVLGVLQLFPSLHAHLPCTTLLAICTLLEKSSSIVNKHAHAHATTCCMQQTGCERDIHCQTLTQTDHSFYKICTIQCF